MVKIKSLEALRGIAALLVLIDHALIFSFDVHEGALFYLATFLGSLGVGAFFLLSGFVIFINIENISTKQFFFQRALRLYPTIIVATIFALLVQIKYKNLALDAQTLKIFLLNISLVGNAFINNEDNILSIVWTLAIEVQFYLLASFVVLISRANFKKRVLFVLLGSIPAIIISSITVIPLPQSPVKVYLGVGLSIIPFMLLGTAFCLFNKKIIEKRGLVVLVASLVVAISYSPYPIYYSLEKGLPSFLIAFAFFLACIYSKSIATKLDKRWLALLGGISYPLYAIHIPVVTLFVCSEKYGGGVGVFMRIIVVSLAISYIVHRYFEAPIHRWSKKSI